MEHTNYVGLCGQVVLAGVGAENFGYTELFLMSTFLQCLFYRAHQIRILATLNSVSILIYSHPFCFQDIRLIKTKTGGRPKYQISVELINGLLDLGFNITNAAQTLGVSQSTVARQTKKVAKSCLEEI